ncbi:hypothetical protein IHQ68_18085 [Chelatococcus sambhunathii]|uniref:Pyroglutamyl-peptidase I n=1 Tax=Chelatococcus sambhunathii TaxID=363953 RepID=A0ABU1DKJ3_9HYPH|nr:hypothetical protein [Chelatococcus sambhunathii]MDR4308533.1 hypothetical protein [Chelatococcus sambhunathii]
MRKTTSSGPGARRLLITAFGRFDGGWNCSEALLSRLRAERDELQSLWGGPVAFALLPVRAATAEAELARALATARPTHVLLTGQAAGRDALSFERVARNRVHIAVADAYGRVGTIGPVRAGGPTERLSNWPDLPGLVGALADAGLPARLSDDAGSHLCNQTLYLALEAAETAKPPFVSTFLHLPLLPEQVAERLPAAARHAQCFAMPIEEMARAVRLVLVHTGQTTA